jgi:thiol-disulfide isomerase/thioredoxin
MYYAPWCGHCKALKPTWVQLSDHVQNTDVVIAKIDMTKNKLEAPEVKGFPTIYFYPAGAEPEVYEANGRALQDLKDFLVKNSSAYRSAFPKEKLPEPSSEVIN